jgi:hypothetical protein
MTSRIVACETVGDGLKLFLDGRLSYRFLAFDLHLDPDKLNSVLQQEIDDTPAEVDTILLGYGMCARGTVGLKARTFRLVIPRVHDCIGLFLGSAAEYARQSAANPGTFYLTKGWIACGDDPYTEYRKMKLKYGHEKAYLLEKRVIQNYTRIALIDTGIENEESMARCRDYARMVARFFDLDFEEIKGTNFLVRRLVNGDWGDDFVVVGPGDTVEYGMFFDGDAEMNLPAECLPDRGRLVRCLDGRGAEGSGAGRGGGAAGADPGPRPGRRGGADGGPRAVRRREAAGADGAPRLPAGGG